jgi:hypothetical protein
MGSAGILCVPPSCVTAEFGGAHHPRVPNGFKQPVLSPEKSRRCRLGMIGIDTASSAQSKRAGGGGESGVVDSDAAVGLGGLWVATGVWGELGAVMGLLGLHWK